MYQQFQNNFACNSTINPMLRSMMVIIIDPVTRRESGVLQLYGTMKSVTAAILIKENKVLFQERQLNTDDRQKKEKINVRKSISLHRGRIAERSCSVASSHAISIIYTSHS